MKKLFTFFESIGSRKFLLTMFIQVIGALGFLKGRMDGGTYVALSTLVLGVYGASSVADKKLNAGSAPPPP